ncbi:hypothetical protein HKB23_13080, partial [Vibrio parahaemolyticus]|nr:hypothetical protein [Vibrio parahaemolyticus]
PQDLVRDAWSVLANFRPSNDAVYARMTLTTGKSNDDTDLNDVIISNKQQDQYVAGYQLLKEISGFHIIAEKAMKEPK